ncbi:MAG: hydroxymethylbilane synthase [Gammaproteobacteria bacterium]|nr:hydroxymethylbilane synthase [Gammaproteobacteria bacterium]
MLTLKIATRKSPLALWQARAVSEVLCTAHFGLHCELLPMTTAGDRLLGAKLTEAGGKSLFVKELERAILDHQADFAVHSMKDVTAQLPAQLFIAAVTAREDPRDVFVSASCSRFEALPAGARVGTASSRRQCQLLALRPDLVVGTVRGNVNTRLAKLDAGDFDALVLAAAGLQRLGLEERINHPFAPKRMLPAAGQGIMGIECRRGDERLIKLLAAVADHDADVRVRAERAVLAALGGGCHAPMAAYAERDGAGGLKLRALVGRLDGSRLVRTEVDGHDTQPEELGRMAAQQLLAQGAGPMLQGA